MDSNIEHSLSGLNASAKHRLAKSLEYVQKYWIPINPDALKHIQEGLKSNRYATDRFALSQDIKSDLSLYAWCIKKVCEKAKKSEEEETDFDPLRKLEELSIIEIEEMLKVDADDISSHRLDNSSKDQVSLLQDTIIGAAAAETASIKMKGDKRAFGATVLRQLGLSLIAWNYESIYNEVLLSLEDKKLDLDTALAQRLGFSPELLATCIVQSWGVSQQKCKSIGLRMNPETGQYEEISPRNSEQEFLWKVCELGEQLARANAPEKYPKSKNKWLDVEKKFEEIVGKGAIASIRKRFEDYCLHYIKKIPAILKSPGMMFNLERYPSSIEVSGAMKNNQYVKTCEPPVRVELRRLYEKLEENNRVDHKKLQILIKEIIPAAGFKGGVVFVFDPTLHKLIPQLHFGKVELIQIKAVDYTLSTQHADLIAAAYQSSDTKQRQGVDSNEKALFGLAGTIGRIRKMGVFYLEGYTQGNYTITEHINHFKAFERTLSDCLKV